MGGGLRMAPLGGGGGEPEMEPWEVPLARHAGSAPRRVGGGFSLAPAAPDRILMTTYETYKALPENPRPYRQEDLDLVAEILRLAYWSKICCRLVWNTFRVVRHPDSMIIAQVFGTSVHSVLTQMLPSQSMHERRLQIH